MKLTEEKLKQLIIEQLGSFELGNLIAYLEELQQVFSSLPIDKQDEVDIDLRKKNGTIYYPGSLSFRSSLEEWFQPAIDSLAREIEGTAETKEWHSMAISRWYATGDSGMPGDIESELKIYRDGSKRFVITQFDIEENELFNYYEGSDISTRGLVDFMSSDEESMTEFAKDHIKTNGETTLDSSTL